LAVRPKGVPLTATRVRSASVVDLIDGRKVPVIADDWLISRDQHVLAVVTGAQLHDLYEVQQEGALTLPPVVVRQLQDRLGPAATGSPDDLLHAVERLAAIKIGEVEVRFTPGQLEELAFRAGKRGRTVQQEVQAVVARIEQELFWGTSAMIGG
jgi:hypothetical protein